MDIVELKGKSYASNTFILISGSDAAIFDPSASVNEISERLSSLHLRAILLTHGHFDHMLSLDELRASYRCDVYVHENDADMLKDPALNASERFGMEFATLGADTLLRDGDTIRLGNEEISVISTPGHTPGSVCYDFGDGLICGDTLFSSGYGRYDLPGGDPYKLVESINKLAQIRENPMLYPGHGRSVRLNDADIIRVVRDNNNYC